MESGARSGWPVPKEPAAKQGQSWVEECSLGWGFHRHALAPWSSAESSSGTCWFFPDQRITCDYISCRGTEHRQQLLLIFNTKSQGNSEERIHYYHRYRGMVDLSTSTSQLFNAFFFSPLLELSKVLETFFCYRRSGLGCNMIHALNDTLFFGFYSALTSHGGLVSTDKPGGIGGHSSTWGNRDALWPCFGKKACLVFYLPNQGPSNSTVHQSGLSGPPRVHCQ